jgi:hypothetical protein
MMDEKTFPIAGPNIANVATTASDTKANRSAYSTKPCPFSHGWYSIDQSFHDAVNEKF